MCFACVKGGLGGTDCVQCSSVLDPIKRTSCFQCIAQANATAWGCLYGGNAPPSPPLNLADAPLWHDPPLPPLKT